MLKEFFEKVNKKKQVRITCNHSAKMEEMLSLSTTCRKNPLCLKRMCNPSLICHFCFSNAQQKRMSNLEKKLSVNYDILTSRILTKEELPVINTKNVLVRYFRFESFGDIANTTHAINYFLIAYDNPDTSFALWTKNPWFIKMAIGSGYKKPENLNIVYSSPYIDKPTKKAIFAVFPFIDKIFTVWTDLETATKNGVVINCGGKHCIDCLLCYDKKFADVKEINELKK